VDFSSIADVPEEADKIWDQRRCLQNALLDINRQTSVSEVAYDDGDETRQGLKITENDEDPLK